jgi:hypothetical protein
VGRRHRHRFHQLLAAALLAGVVLTAAPAAEAGLLSGGRTPRVELDTEIVDALSATIAPSPARHFSFATASELANADRRLSLARRYDALIVKGTAPKADLDAMRLLNPEIALFNYEQGAALNREERKLALAWMARDDKGNFVRPKSIKGVWLMDLTIAAAREWRAARVGAETLAGGYDGSFLDTLGAYFPATFYTSPTVFGRRGEISDRQWRDGSVELTKAVRRASRGKPVIVNGFGLGSGRDFFKHKQDASMLVAAADGVQIEHFTRTSKQSASQFISKEGWREDVDFLQLLSASNKRALAKVSLADDIQATELERLRVRNFGLGTFLLGHRPNLSYFSYRDGLRGEVEFAEAWPDLLGDPVTSAPRIEGGVWRRPFDRGEVAVNPTDNVLMYQGLPLLPKSATAAR